MFWWVRVRTQEAGSGQLPAGTVAAATGTLYRSRRDSASGEGSLGSAAGTPPCPAPALHARRSPCPAYSATKYAGQWRGAALNVLLLQHISNAYVLCSCAVFSSAMLPWPQMMVSIDDDASSSPDEGSEI
jgi:hypothetical protein